MVDKIPGWTLVGVSDENTHSLAMKMLREVCVYGNLQCDLFKSNVFVHREIAFAGPFAALFKNYLGIRQQEIKHVFTAPVGAQNAAFIRWNLDAFEIDRAG